MIDFNSIIAKIELPQWVDTPESLKEASTTFIKDQLELNDLLASTDNPTLENSFVPLVNFNNETSFRQNQIGFYQYVSPNKELRDISTKVDDDVSNFSIEQDLRVDLYNSFHKLNNLVKDDPNASRETKKYLDKKVKYYQRNGLALSQDERDVIKEIKLEISDLKSQFSKNLNEDTSFLSFTIEELEGVPIDVTSSFAKIKEDGVEKLKMTFKYPDILPVLKSAKRQETRKKASIGKENNNHANAEVLNKLIKLRYKLAKALKYNSFSAYTLEDRMAKNETTVLDFLDDLRTKFKPIGEKQLQVLLDLKNEDLKSQGLPTQDEFYFWDFTYYHDLLLTSEYNVDFKVISEYYPLDSTIAGMFGIFETLFDVKFVEAKPNATEVWHEDVKVFGVFQDVSQGDPDKLKFMGWIYLDMHPRDGKYGHAANFSNGPGYRRQDGNMQHTVTMLVCNFTKPTSEKPSLLDHKEVVTFFHELGHGVHSLLSQTDLSMLHTSVERDFVEAPSQMLEYWTWSAKELKSLSKHYKTGEQIGDDLINQLIASKNVNGGLFNLRQLHYGLFDMKCHILSSQGEIDNFDLFDLWNTLRTDITLHSDQGVRTSGYASFGHIGGGYESAYYGYLYSLVYATDMFYTLFKDNPMSVDSGLKYRDIILTRGGTRDSMENLEDLLGRKPNGEAFFKELFN